MDAEQEKYHVEKKRASPVKVLSSQLRDGECCNGYQGKIECNLKRQGEAKNTPFVVSVVWMQGTILEVHSDNSARLSDETGTFVVNGFRNIPKGKPCLCQGELHVYRFSSQFSEQQKKCVIPLFSRRVYNGDGCHPGNLSRTCFACS